jgi:acyl-CoA thioesterase
MAPVTTRVSVLRQGRRLAVLRAELLAGESLVAVAHGSFLATGTMPACDYAAELEGPEGLETEKLLPDRVYEVIGRGFHSFVEVRWLRRAETGTAAWFRMPGPLVEGERTLPFERAATLSDYVSAVCSLGGPGHRSAFINTDTSIHFAREPEDEWIGLQATGVGDSGGAGFAEALMFDARGPVGRAVQARLGNESAWRS